MMETITQGMLDQLASPLVLVFPHWDAGNDGLRLFLPYCCGASQDVFGATLEQPQIGGDIRPIAYLNRVKLDNDKN